MNKQILNVEVENLIYNVRDKAVMLDSDLAKLYQIETRSLNQAVRRNIDRFPADFMIQLTRKEVESLRSQNVISKRGGRRYLPNMFTEQGVAMLSSILNTKVAIMANIQIMRTFVKIRRFGMTTQDLKRKLDGMERKYDQQFRVVFQAIRQLIELPKISKKRKMGFTADKVDQL